MSTPTIKKPTTKPALLIATTTPEQERDKFSTNMPAVGVGIREAPQAFSSESSKWRPLAARYLTGNGVELATGGDSIMPTSIQFELTPPTYAHYNSAQPLRGVVHWRSDDAIFHLPFKDKVLDYVASSHLLEDFNPEDQFKLLTEWVRVIKPGGKLLVCVPDNTRWDKAVAGGQCPNCAHRHCFYVGELSGLAPKLGLSTICDKFTEMPVGDYNILYCGEVM